MGLDLSQAGRFLLRLVSAARRRKLRVDFLGGFLEAFFCLSFLVAAFFLLDRIRLEVWPGGSCLSPREWILASLAVASAASLAFGLAMAWWRAPSSLAAAKSIDDAFGLHDRVGTAIDVVEGRTSGRLGPLVVADTVRAVQDLDVRRAYPFPAPGHRVLSALALGVTIWLAFLPIPSPETATDGDADRAYTLPDLVGPDADPYVRFEKLPNDPRVGKPKSWTPPKEREHPPWDRPKPPKPDPPSALPSPEFSPQPKPKGGGGGGQPPPPQPTDPPPPPGGGGGGQAPGAGGGSNPLFGEKERIPVNRIRKDVKPLLGGGRGKIREMEIDDGGGDSGNGAAGGTSAPQDFKTLYQQYQRLSESALAPERVSPEDRDLVKRYFQQIEPR